MNSLEHVTNPLVTKEDIEDHYGLGLIIKRDDGKICMLRHAKYGFFTIPIGKAALHEPLEHIVCKEANEELDIIVKDMECLGHFRKVYDRGNDISTTIETYIYEITEYEGTPKNNEPDKHEFMTWRFPSSIIDMYNEENLSDATVFYLHLLNILERGCKQI